MGVILNRSWDHPLVAEAMVVDDQPTSRIILETVLRGIGDNVRVHAFDDPRSALRAAEARAPDLIIADYKMPGMDGVTFTKRVRQLPDCQDVPIVIITIVDDKSVMYSALEAGATDFLTKPVDHYECKVRCRNLLTMRRQQLIIRNRAISLENRVRQELSELEQREQEALTCLARIASIREGQPAGAEQRCGAIARAIAQELRLNPAVCEAIFYAAPLHDIGKIGVPDTVLYKPGPLSPGEAEVLKRHVRVGHELLHGGRSRLQEMAAVIALSHHEHWDGTGYPRGLSGEQIPVEARIAAVADVFDALISDRPYRRAWHPRKALDEVARLRGTRLDPDCVDALFRCIDEILSGMDAPRADSGEQ